MDPARVAEVQLALKGALAGEALGLVALYARRRVTLPAVIAAGALSMVLSFETWDRVQDGRPDLLLLFGAGALVVCTSLLASVAHPDSLRWLPTAAAASAVVAWSAASATQVILVVGGTVVALAFMAVVAREPATALASAALAGGVVFAALHGNSPTDLRNAGAVACLGLFIWWPIGRALRRAVEVVVPDLPGIWPGPWIFAAHLSLAVAGARWIAGAPDATAARLVIVGAVGTAVAAVSSAPARRGSRVRAERA